MGQICGQLSGRPGPVEDAAPPPRGGAPTPVRGGAVECARPGCSRPPWNGRAGEYCGKACKAAGGGNTAPQYSQAPVTSMTQQPTAPHPSTLPKSTGAWVKEWGEGVWQRQSYGDSESPGNVGWEAVTPDESNAIDEACWNFTKKKTANEVQVEGKKVDVKLFTIEEDPKNLKAKMRGKEAVCIRPGCERLSWSKKPGDFCGKSCNVKGPCVCPLRRVGNGRVVQTHPKEGELHPLYLQQVQSKEDFSKTLPDSWLTNDFFWEAFTKAVKEGGGSITDAEKHKMFDFRFNEDFRKVTKEECEGRLMRRGGVLYREPFGWKRFCIRVAGKYDKHLGPDKCDDWLSNWAVGYHGCPMMTVPLILKSSFRPGALQGARKCFDVRDGEAVGDGIYCSPNPLIIECYSNGEEGKNQDGSTKGAACTLHGHTVFFALMCRVNPDAIRRPDRHFAHCNDEEVMGLDGTFEWVIRNPENIRPYAVMIRDQATSCHRPLGDMVKKFNAEHKPLPKGTFDRIPGKELDPHHRKTAASYEKAVKILCS